MKLAPQREPKGTTGFGFSIVLTMAILGEAIAEPASDAQDCHGPGRAACGGEAVSGSPQPGMPFLFRTYQRQQHSCRPCRDPQHFPKPGGPRFYGKVARPLDNNCAEFEGEKKPSENGQNGSRLTPSGALCNEPDNCASEEMTA